MGLYADGPGVKVDLLIFLRDWVNEIPFLLYNDCYMSLFKLYVDGDGTIVLAFSLGNYKFRLSLGKEEAAFPSELIVDWIV